MAYRRYGDDRLMWQGGSPTQGRSQYQSTAGRLPSSFRVARQPEAINIPAERMTSAAEKPCSAGTWASSPAGAFLIAVHAETSKAKTAGR